MELFSTAWDVFSTAIILIFGFFLCGKLGKNFGLRTSRAITLYVWHTVFCVFYVVYIINGGGDTMAYFVRAQEGAGAFAPGSRGLMLVTHFLVDAFGLSFLSVNLLFNIAGSIGLLAVAGSVRVAVAGAARHWQLFSAALTFLPSMSFWTSALGKDSISFLAVGLSLWAALDVRKRTLLAVASVFIIFTVRPHIAVIMIAAYALSFTFDKGIKPATRLVFGTVACLASLLIVPFALGYVGLGAGIGADEVIDYVDGRQQVNMHGGGAVDIASMSPPARFFTYMFRPLPHEASNMMSLAASLDNICILVVVVAAIFFRFRTRATVVGASIFMWAYALLTWLILSETTANLGISVRQKWMFAPMVIYLALSYVGSRRDSATQYAQRRQ